MFSKPSLLFLCVVFVTEMVADKLNCINEYLTTNFHSYTKEVQLEKCAYWKELYFIDNTYKMLY